jgi:hypothetical protein
MLNSWGLKGSPFFFSLPNIAGSLMKVKNRKLTCLCYRPILAATFGNHVKMTFCSVRSGSAPSGSTELAEVSPLR